MDTRQESLETTPQGKSGQDTSDLGPEISERGTEMSHQPSMEKPQEEEDYSFQAIKARIEQAQRNLRGEKQEMPQGGGGEKPSTIQTREKGTPSTQIEDKGQESLGPKEGMETTRESGVEKKEGEGLGESKMEERTDIPKEQISGTDMPMEQKGESGLSEKPEPKISEPLNQPEGSSLPTEQGIETKQEGEEASSSQLGQGQTREEELRPTEEAKPEESQVPSEQGIPSEKGLGEQELPSKETSTPTEEVNQTRPPESMEQQISQAKEGLGTEEQSKESLREGLGKAEEGLGQAQEGLGQAQEGLGQARDQAKETPLKEESTAPSLGETQGQPKEEVGQGELSEKRVDQPSGAVSGGLEQGEPTQLPPAEEAFPQPTEQVSPAKEEGTEPKEELSKPTELSKPSEELSKPTEEISKPTEELSKPSEELSKPTEELPKSTEEISQPKPSEPLQPQLGIDQGPPTSESQVAAKEELTPPQEGLAQPEQPKEDISKPLEFPKPSEELTKPTEELTKPTEEISQPTEEVTEPKEEISKPTEEISRPTEEPVKPTEEISQPSEEISKPKEEEVTQPQEVPKPTEEISTPTEEVLKPTEEISKPKEEVTQPQEEVPKSTEEISKPEASLPQEELSLPRLPSQEPLPTSQETTEIPPAPPVPPSLQDQGQPKETMEAPAHLKEDLTHPKLADTEAILPPEAEEPLQPQKEEEKEEKPILSSFKEKITPLSQEEISKPKEEGKILEEKGVEGIGKKEEVPEGQTVFGHIRSMIIEIEDLEEMMMGQEGTKEELPGKERTLSQDPLSTQSL